MAEPAACVVLVSAPGEEVAATLARTLVEERWIACATLVPGVRSVYRWKGEVHDEPEVLLVLKAPAGRFEALRARIVELHPYEVPEVLQLDVTGAHPPYLAWLLDAAQR